MYVDNTKELTVVEWFTGYGGNELGLSRVLRNMRPIAFCERESFVVANLVAKMEAGLMDPVPVWSDVTTFPIEPFKDRVGLFIASYPCQPFSHAGKRDGQNDDRHLWPSCRRFICGAHPGLVFLENVEGHVSLGLSTVLADLEEDGYTAAWGIFSAAEVGAPHQRKRVFILAYDRLQRQAVNELKTTGVVKCGAEDELALGYSIGCPYGEPEIQPAETGVNALGNAGTGHGEDVAHFINEGLQGHAGDVHGGGRESGGTDRPVAEGGVCGVNLVDSRLFGQKESEQQTAGLKQSDQVWPSRPGASQYGWEPPRVVGNASEPRTGDNIGGVRGMLKSSTEHDKHRGQTQPPLGGNANGPADGLDFPGCTGLNRDELEEVYGWMVKGTNRTDELRMCGNGVVPQTAERAFRVLHAELCRDRKTERELIGDL